MGLGGRRRLGADMRARTRAQEEAEDVAMDSGGG